MTRPLLPALLLTLASSFAGGCASPCDKANGLQRDPAMQTCVFSADLEADEPTTLTPEDGAPVAFTVPPYEPGGQPTGLPDGTELVESYYGLSWTGTGGDQSVADSASGVGSMTLAPDHGRYALGMRLGGRVLVRTVDGDAEADAFEGADALVGLPNRATHLAFSPDGSLLAGSDALHNVVVWETATGKRQWSANVGEGVPTGDGIRTVAFSPDGAFVAAATQHVVHVWEAATGTPVATWVHPGKTQVTDVVFTPDGNHVAVRKHGLYIAEHTTVTTRDRRDPLRRHDAARSVRTPAVQKAPTVFVWRLP